MGSGLHVLLLLAAAYSLFGVVILIHELGHAVAFRWASPKPITVVVGQAGRSITLRFAKWDFRIHAGLNAGRCVSDKTGLTVGQLRRIGYAGASASAIGCLGFAALAFATQGEDRVMGQLLMGASIVSLSVALSSLVSSPIRGKSTDGSRMHALKNLPRDSVLHPMGPNVTEISRGSIPPPQAELGRNPADNW
jgi:hypothetical protein